MDHVIATYFPAPASYTGEDVVEISAHGSPVVLASIVDAAVRRGARMAEPGEFTLRAYLNGRMDLVQAEAVVDLIDAVTPLQARVAFDQVQGTLTVAIGEIDEALFDLIARLEASIDFPEEGYHFIAPESVATAIDAVAEQVSALLSSARRGRLVREGLHVAIVGPPNVGKSSLFNALVGSARAIVTDVPGTTRDLVTEVIDVEGLRVTLTDTAGLRQTSDEIELEGVSRSRGAAAVADLVLVVADGSNPAGHSREYEIQISDNKRLIVENKSDIARSDREDAIKVSAKTGDGLEALRRHIVEALDIDLLADRPGITNARHVILLERATNALQRARAAAMTDGKSLSEEFVLADLYDAQGTLGEVTGKRVPEDVLAHIFARFCVGK